jgi:hypothetical protein
MTDNKKPNAPSQSPGRERSTNDHNIEKGGDKRSTVNPPAPTYTRPKTSPRG